MSFSPKKVFYAGIASGASTSSYMNFGGVGFDKLAVQVVTMSTGTPLTIYGSDTANGTYYPLLERALNTSTVAYNSFNVATATSGTWVVFSNFPPLDYIKFVGAAVVSGGVSITAIAS